MVRWWDLAGGQMEGELRLGTSLAMPIHAAAFSADGERVLVCRGRPRDARAVLEVHHLASGARELGAHRGVGAASVTALTLHPNGHRAALTAQGYLDVVDLASGARLIRTSSTGKPAFSPEGDRIVLLERGRAGGGPPGGTLFVSDLAPGSPPRATPLTLDGIALALHPDGARVLLVGEQLPTPSDPDARGLAFVVHRLDDGARIASEAIDIDPVTALAFGPRSGGMVTDRIVLGHADGQVIVADWSVD